MDDRLRDFLTETNDSLEIVDVELVRFEQDPNDAKIPDNIFRLVHTIKGTCGFLGLPRLEALTHAAETLMGRFRDGMEVTGDAVTLILSTIDRITELLAELERMEREPGGSDQDLIGRLAQAVVEHASAEESPAAGMAAESPAFMVPRRPLRPGEDVLDDLERGFARRPALSRRRLPSLNRRGPRPGPRPDPNGEDRPGRAMQEARRRISRWRPSRSA